MSLDLSQDLDTLSGSIQNHFPSTFTPSFLSHLDARIAAKRLPNIFMVLPQSLSASARIPP